MSKPKFLIVLTSQGIIPANRAKTGWYLKELAHPYTVLFPHLSLVLTSPEGGEAPLDPTSVHHDDDAPTMSFLDANRSLWTRTVPLREIVASADEYVGVFFVGGHGPMFDLITNPASLAVVQTLAAKGKPIAAVCHGSVALLNATAPSGVPLLFDARVTGISNEEERAIAMDEVMPFELETELDRVSGGGYVKADEIWGEKVVVSKTAGTGTPVITGQNPASAAGVAREILKVLRQDAT